MRKEAKQSRAFDYPAGARTSTKALLREGQTLQIHCAGKPSDHHRLLEASIAAPITGSYHLATKAESGVTH